MAKSSTQYACTECGWRTSKWLGKCGDCAAWGTLDEVAVEQGFSGTKTKGSAGVSAPARPITEVAAGVANHAPTGIGELDRVLGGGIVPGAAILLSGEPGVGKSTLLLETAARVASRGERVLYISGEESTGQIRLRAERIGALSENLFLVNETDLGAALAHIEQVNPDLTIVDSVQTIASSAVDGLSGGTAQVREVASVLVRVAKQRGAPMVIVGHVTKDGNIAGPRLLEHLVDVVCHFEGDQNTSLRFLRTLKNRFGATDEVGCFEMVDSGIAEVADPSGLFISRSAEPVSGTCVGITLEGRRVLPVEVQALVLPSSAPNPRRVTNGISSARVSMILAVLEKRVRVRLHDKDVYVSTVGGVSLAEPGADLAVALAIASAATDTPLGAGLAAVGELSLAGEVRAVHGQRQRVQEAKRLGYTTVITDKAQNLLNASRIAVNTGRPGRVEQTAVENR